MTAIRPLLVAPSESSRIPAGSCCFERDRSGPRESRRRKSRPTIVATDGGGVHPPQLNITLADFTSCHQTSQKSGMTEAAPIADSPRLLVFLHHWSGLAAWVAVTSCTAVRSAVFIGRKHLGWFARFQSQKLRLF